MTDNRKIYLTITAVLILLLLAVFSFFFVTDSLSLKSVLSAGGPVSIPAHKTLRLNHGWESYSDEQMQIKSGISPRVFRTGNYFFRLELETDGMKGVNAFLVNPIHSAYRLWVNGELIAQNGVPGADGEELGVLVTHVVPYEQTADNLEVILQVSNSSHKYGGSMLNWLSYGRSEDIVYLEQQGRALDYLIIFGLFSIFLIHVFYAYNQNEFVSERSFCLITLVYTFIALFTGRVMVSSISPWVNAGFIFRGEMFFTIVAFPLIINYLSSLFPDEASKKLNRVFQIISVLSAVAAVLLPLYIGRQIAGYYDFVKIAGSVYITVILVRAVKARRSWAKLNSTGFITLFICMLNDGLFSWGIIQSVRLIFVGIFIFAIYQTLELFRSNESFNREARATNSRLDVLMRQKDNFFSRNSLELDKPIRNIVELGESLLKGSIGALNSEQIATSSLIVSNGIRLANMVNDILDFTYIRDKTVELDRGPVDLMKVSRKVVNSCEALISVNKINLISEIDRQTPFVEADERRIEQVLYNIITNSIRHMQRGDVRIGAEQEEDRLRVIITLDGSDLDKDKVTTLFNAYDIDDKDDIDEKDLTDLSLAIAKKLIELHDSDITVENNGRLLNYSFTFPIWSGERELSEEEDLALDALINIQPVLDEVASDRDIEILVAGKDIEELQIFKTQLASMSYSVIPMLSGKDLIERVNDSPAHLVLIDVKLPDMSGYEVCSEIRKLYSKDELPVILVINKEDVSEMMEGLTSGANDFLTRPYIQEEFLTRINTHLQLSRISTVYSRFVPTEFLNSLGQENIVDVELGDQVQREMTILFVDIRSFTNLSEHMTPEENFKFINSYLSRFSPMITENGGFVDKYIGDAIMALFPDSPDNALAAAKEMIEHVNVYNGHRANCGYKPINIGIGIHTGKMILGVIGDKKRMQGTVISDAVNLASRIQDVTKLYRANVVISQETFVKLENPMDYNFRFLGRVKVKGKDKAVALFEIYDSDIEEKRICKDNTKADFEEGIMRFSRKEFKEAKQLLERVVSENPDDHTAQLFIDRIEQMVLAEKKNFLTSL